MASNKPNLLKLFLIDLLVLIYKFIKSYIQSVFRYLFRTQKSVRHEIVLITGSAKGLGRHLALEFAKLGSILVLIDVDDTENEKTIQLLKSEGLHSKRIFAYHCDLKSVEKKAIIIETTYCKHVYFILGVVRKSKR